MTRAALDAETSRTEFVYEQLRSDVLEGRIAPGERLKLPALVSRFGLSMTVVREALTRLAEQGLVISNPKRGFSVMALSVDHLKDLTHARLRLEVMILRDSIEGAGMEWETAVVSSHYALNRTDSILADGSLNTVWMQAHRAFHHALGSGCGSPQLIAITSALRDSAELYRAWAHTLADDSKRDVTAEHDRIVAAALARDSDAAVEALKIHIGHTSEILLRYALTGAAPG